MKQLDNNCMATAMRVTVITRQHPFDYICIVTSMCLGSENFSLQLSCASEEPVLLCKAQYHWLHDHTISAEAALVVQVQAIARTSLISSLASEEDSTLTTR